VVQYALSRRPNVKLVETGLTFGVEGFRNFEGRRFAEGMGMTRRFYPHRYNVDGFFVSKVRKTGPTIRSGKGDALREGKGGEVDVQVGEGDRQVDGHGGKVAGANGKGQKNGEAKAGSPTEDTFGGWDESEDERIIERAQRRCARKKGMDPNAGSHGKGNPNDDAVKEG